MEKSEPGALGLDATCLGCVLHCVWWKKQEIVKADERSVGLIHQPYLCVYECFCTEIIIH